MGRKLLIAIGAFAVLAGAVFGLRAMNIATAHARLASKSFAVPQTRIGCWLSGGTAIEPAYPHGDPGFPLNLVTTHHCTIATTDGGKACTSSADCQGVCLASAEDAARGTNVYINALNNQPVTVGTPSPGQCDGFVPDPLERTGGSYSYLENGQVHQSYTY